MMFLSYNDVNGCDNEKEEAMGSPLQSVVY